MTARPVDRSFGLWILAWIISGCQATTPERQSPSHMSMLPRYSSTKEAMCLHCNCLMPAGVDPESICPVCKCGKKARECVH